MNINVENLTNLRNNNFMKNVSEQNLSKNTIKNIKINDYNLNSQQKSTNLDELKILLSNIGLSTSKENIDIVKLLINSGLTINRENINTLNKSIKLFKENSIEKGLMLIKNNISPTEDMVKQIDGYISKDISLQNQIKLLFENIFSDNNVEDIIKVAFSNEMTFTKNVTSKLDHIDNLLNEIKTELKDIFVKNDASEATDILDKNINTEPGKQTISKNEVSGLSEYILKNDTVPKDKDIIEFFDKVLNKRELFNNKNLQFVKDFMLSSKNIKILDNIDSKENFEKDIFKMIKLLPKSNKAFSEVIENIESLKNEINKNFSFDFENSNVEDLKSFFEEINNMNIKLKEFLENNSDKSSDSILKDIENINKNLEFMSNMKDSIYLQIPLNINNFSTNAELFVFKDKKTKKNINDDGSALISLNLFYIGNIEIYIQKVNRGVFCQFRLEKENIKNLIQENANLLEIYIQEKNFSLKNISFKNIDESFSIISNEKENLKNFSSENFKISNFNVKA